MNKAIAKINKNALELVVIRLSEFKGRDLIDIRIWMKPEDPREGGELKPTKKGISLGIDAIPELIQALQKAQRALDEAGNRPEKPREGRSLEDEGLAMGANKEVNS